MSERLVIDHDDAYLEDMALPECDDCERAATVGLRLALRGMGKDIQVGMYCDGCGRKALERLTECIADGAAHDASGEGNDDR